MKAVLKISILFILITVVSCKKAGLGGDATIVAYPQHHGTPIKGATVYVKFNTEDFPGASPSNFDTRFTGMIDEDHVNCTGLNAGKYYLYAIGYDSTRSQNVSGGVPVKIKHKERKDDIIVYVPVSEQ